MGDVKRIYSDGQFIDLTQGGGDGLKVSLSISRYKLLITTNRELTENDTIAFARYWIASARRNGCEQREDKKARWRVNDREYSTNPNKGYGEYSVSGHISVSLKTKRGNLFEYIVLDQNGEEIDISTFDYFGDVAEKFPTQVVVEPNYCLAFRIGCGRKRLLYRLNSDHSNKKIFSLRYGVCVNGTIYPFRIQVSNFGHYGPIYTFGEQVPLASGGFVLPWTNFVHFHID